MRMGWLMPRWAVEGSCRIAGQVIISLSATAAIALLGPLFMKDAPKPAAQPGESHGSELAVLNLLKGGFEPGGARARGLYPSEFEALAPPALPPVMAATPSVVLVSETPVPSPKPIRKPAVASTAQACGGGECQIAMMPPSRPMDQATVRLEAPAATLKAPEGIRLLGIPLPGFIPATGETIVRSGEIVVKSAASIGSSILDLTSRIIP